MKGTVHLTLGDLMILLTNAWLFVAASFLNQILISTFSKLFVLRKSIPSINVPKLLSNMPQMFFKVLSFVFTVGCLITVL